MNNSLYIAYAGMSADMRALDVAANNLANASTNGYREERSFVEALESAAGQSFPRVGGTEPNTQTGPLVATGRNLDVAIEGDGYLVVETAAGRRYTRDGSLSRDQNGLLVTREGMPVLGQGGHITLRSQDTEFEIDPDGRVLVNAVQSGRLLVVQHDPSTLVRESGGLYRSESTTEVPATESRLRQGFLEQSNVDIPSGDIAQLRRHFQSLSRAMTTLSGLERRLISTVRGQ